MFPEYKNYNTSRSAPPPPSPVLPATPSLGVLTCHVVCVSSAFSDELQMVTSIWVEDRDGNPPVALAVEQHHSRVIHCDAVGPPSHMAHADQSRDSCCPVWCWLQGDRWCDEIFIAHFAWLEDATYNFSIRFEQTTAVEDVSGAAAHAS